MKSDRFYLGIGIIFGRRQAQLDAAAERIGRNVTAIQADATDLQDLERVASAVRAEKGFVDIVVSNAALVEQASIDTLTPEHFDKTFNLNARSPVFLVQKLLPLMTKGGSIILVSCRLANPLVAEANASVDPRE